VSVRFRIAGPDDAAAVAELHAESWRRHYRGAYSDAFLDGEVFEDRRAVWSERLRTPDPRRLTLLAQDGTLVGFANTFIGEDPTWGALLDNLHVAASHMRRGIGSELLTRTARALGEQGHETGLYLWVLEQNVDAQAFYRAHDATFVERSPASPPGEIASRLTGSPARLRFAWPDPASLLGS
jgi:ribosomal protein S18 acetylase RimI-like enzyme